MSGPRCLGIEDVKTLLGAERLAAVVNEAVEIAVEVQALPPPAQLRLAADLLERGRPVMALAIVRRLAVELGVQPAAPYVIHNVASPDRPPPTRLGGGG